MKTFSHLNKRRRPHTIRKYIILPSCLVAYNILEEILFYKAQVIENTFLRTGVILLLFILGISIVAFIVVPFLERFLKGLYKSSKQHGGIMGECLFMLALGIVFYLLYYAVYVYGPESLLPHEWRN